MRMSRLFVLLAAALLVLAPFAAAECKDKDLDPTFTGETGLFTIYLGDTLPQGGFHFGLVAQNFDRETTDFDGNFFNIVFAYGITDQLEVAASFAPITQVNFVHYYTHPDEVLNSNPVMQPIIRNNGMGDARLGLKFRLIDSESAPAVAIRAFVKLPVADYDKGFGTGAVDFGGTLIVSKDFSETFELAGNVGYMMVGQPDELIGELSDELSYGAGFGWLILPDAKLKVLGEVKGIAYANDDDYPQVAPLEVFLGLQKRFAIAPKYDLRLGLGFQANVGFDTDVAENPQGGGLMITVGPSKNIPPVIQKMEGDKAAGCVGAPLNFSAVATDENGDDLMYSWIVNDQPVDGNTWTPAEPGNYKVTVVVDDGRDCGKVMQTMDLQVFPPPTVKLSVNADTVYLTKKYTVTASITNPGDYPLTYNWSVDIGTISPMTNQAEALWDLTTGEPGEATIKLEVMSELGCSATGDLKVTVLDDPCKIITDEELTGEVYFPLNKYTFREPTEEAYKIFDRVIEKMKLCEEFVIRLEGHCCYLGTKDYNMCLGWWRAEAVLKYFVEHGIPRERIKTISYGKEKPKYDNSTEATRKDNRRVEISNNKDQEVPEGPDKDKFIEKCKKKYSRWLK